MAQHGVVPTERHTKGEEMNLPRPDVLIIEDIADSG
jgi:hypothetical protein